MKFSTRAGISALLMSLMLASGIAMAEPSPSSTKPPPKETPNPKLDPKTEAELLQAEDRFINAIRNGDAKELEKLLADYYADSAADEERAMNKQGALARVAAGNLPAYPIEAKGRRLTHSADIFTIEGQAKKLRSEDSDEPPKEEWLQVRRRWTKQGDRWLLVAQRITSEEDNDPDAKKSEQK